MYRSVAEEGVVHELQARGFDIVLHKLHNAAGYIQRNAFALEHLLGRLGAVLPPGAQIDVIGPSMGGLIARYALAYMEQQGLDHRVRTYVSYDAPHRGANIPLGDQFFVYFFRKDSEFAQQALDALNSPAARQMLIYQYAALLNRRLDPLRETLKAELETLGYPTTVRRVAIADGSGYGRPQRGNERVGFAYMRPGDHIVEYTYRKKRFRLVILSLRGNVWAVPDGGSPIRIFQGLKSSLFGILDYHRLNVYVGGTEPLDSAPGGTRASQGEIASTDPPYGRIYTSFPTHSWIPTTSALDLPTNDLYYNVETDPAGIVTAGAGGKRSTATYDAVYYPVDNEAHVDARTDNATFLLNQLGRPLPSLAAELAHGNEEGVRLSDVYPNPFNPQAQVTLMLAADQQVRAEVFNPLGQRVAVLHDGMLSAREPHALRFDAAGLPSGLYVLRVIGEAFTATRTMTLLR